MAGIMAGDLDRGSLTTSVVHSFKTDFPASAAVPDSEARLDLAPRVRTREVKRTTAAADLRLGNTTIRVSTSKGLPAGGIKKVDAGASIGAAVPVDEVDEGEDITTTKAFPLCQFFGILASVLKFLMKPCTANNMRLRVC